jgi:uncharacterized protein (DUF302 family)
MSESNSSQLIIHSSPHSPSELLEKLKKIFQAKSITLFALIDHSGEAHKAGLELQIEQLLIFGDPKTGTFLMQENPAIGIELPLKILLWQTPEGKTQIAYKDPNYLAEVYGIKKNAGILKKMKEALDTLIANVKN